MRVLKKWAPCRRWLYAGGTAAVAAVVDARGAGGAGRAGRHRLGGTLGAHVLPVGHDAGPVKASCCARGPVSAMVLPSCCIRPCRCGTWRGARSSSS
ncbi:MAG: hypothetical protein ACLSVD_17325 [Eggerthellaceae bacterium]